MTQRAIAIAWLALVWTLLWAAACAETTPEVSSGSNWLTCESVDDCDDGRAVRCSGDGYCLDTEGDRIEAPSPEAMEPLPDPASASSPGSSSGTGTSPVAAEAGAPTGGEPPASVAPGDAGVALATFGGLAACELAGARDPLVPRADETCYDFPVHGASSPTDTTPFTIPVDENYNQFYFAVPWEAGAVATSYGVVDETGLAVHAWLFSSSAAIAPGMVSRNVLGTLLGEQASMLGAWAVGSCNVVMPDTIGLQLPEAGNVVVQWHYLNDTGNPVDDTSVFRVCTAPAGSRSQLAGMTVLGTESIDLPPGMHSVSGTCINDSGAPVTLLMLAPHMHRYGARMTTVVERTAGGTTIVLEAPFRFDQRSHYLLEPSAVVEPGDALRTECTYGNDTTANIPFGQSAWQEMCFQMAISTPPVALDNGVISLIGALNTCW